MQAQSTGAAPPGCYPAGHGARPTTTPSHLHARRPAVVAFWEDGGAASSAAPCRMVRAGALLLLLLPVEHAAVRPRLGCAGGQAVARRQRHGGLVGRHVGGAVGLDRGGARQAACIDWLRHTRAEAHARSERRDVRIWASQRGGRTVKKQAHQGMLRQAPFATTIKAWPYYGARHPIMSGVRGWPCTAGPCRVRGAAPDALLALRSVLLRCACGAGVGVKPCDGSPARAEMELGWWRGRGWRDHWSLGWKAAVRKPRAARLEAAEEPCALKRIPSCAPAAPAQQLLTTRTARHCEAFLLCLATMYVQLAAEGEAAGGQAIRPVLADARGRRAARP